LEVSLLFSDIALNDKCKNNNGDNKVTNVLGREVYYTSSRWRLINKLRDEAKKVIKALKTHQVRAEVHGSLSRGDVNKNSDIDVFISYSISSHKVELALQLAGYKFYSRKIAQATPRHTPKAHIFLDPEKKSTVTFPLTRFRRLEMEFYNFGGVLDLTELERDIRVPGINKQLLLIQPTPKGHIESYIIGKEAVAAKIVGVSLEVVQERVRVLTRRKETGRTGIFVSKEVGPDQSFEEVLKQISETNPIVRRHLNETT
jgi:predicted nucleotidyltransferase